MAGDSPGAAAAANVWATAVRDRRPAAVVRAQRAEDVAATFAWAAEVGAVVTPRSGGHSFDGFPINEDVVLIDMRDIDHARIDAAGLLNAGAGALARDIHLAGATSGRAVPIGLCPTVGLGGLVSGGGFGYFSRSLGVTCDSLVAATVATPDGAVLRCDETENTEVLWATRGGGGCAGIIIDTQLRSIVVDTVIDFAVGVPWSAFVDCYATFIDLVATAPESLDASIQARTTGAGRYIDTADVGPPGSTLGQPHVEVTGQMRAPIDEVRDTIAPLLNLDGARLDMIEAVELATAARHENPLEFFNDPAPPALRSYRVTSDFVTSTDVDRQAQALSRFIDVVQHDPLLGGMGVVIEGANGQVAARSASATAFPHRDAVALIQYQLGCPDGRSPRDPDYMKRGNELLAETRAALGEAPTGGRYLNYADPSDPASTLWRGNLERLRRIVDAVDPHRVLHSRLRPLV